METEETVGKRKLRSRLRWWWNLGPKMDTQETVDTGDMNKPVPPYARLFFDHLYSEYLVLKPSITDPNVTALMEEICQKRQKRDLTWANIYSFDLTLVDMRPPESLVRKAYDARGRYRSIAGQKEYDEYLASKPPDLTEIQLKPNTPPPDPIELLRADIKYLLSKFYLYYAMLPVRESLRDELTRNAVLLTGAVVMFIAGAILINVFFAVFSNTDVTSVFVTVLTVTLAGIVGGCVSMLQRIQSAPSEGDALFNLAALTNGWRGIILSPLYGGIFASLLFVLFAAGVLNGSVFPVISTPKSEFEAAPLPNPSPVASPSSSPDAKAVSLPLVLAKEPLQIKEFLRKTGPVDGVSYALLIIWSFLAGFAERLVPDTLNRLVAKNQAIQGNNG
jgi:hypothetical protein